MYYKFVYQNDEYAINLDKIEYIIKSSDFSNRVLIGLSDKMLEFSFNSKEKVDEFYENLQKAIIEGMKKGEIRI